MTHQVELGIIGLGHVYDWQAKALDLVGELQVVGGTDAEREKASKLSSGRFFDSVDELLSSNIRAVLVSTPPATHHAIATKALEAGKDVLLEKPATLDQDELSDLYARARSSGRLLVVAFHAAFAGDVRWIVEALETGGLDYHGGLDFARMSFFDPYLTPTGINPAHRALGGSWIDSGINALSVLGSIVTHVTLVEARVTVLPQVSELDVASVVDLAITDRNTGRRGGASIETNWALGINRKTTSLRFVDGTDVLLDHSGQRVVERSSDGSQRTLADFSRAAPRLVTHYVGVFRDFVKRLRQRDDNEEFTRVTHRLLFEARDRAIRFRTA